MCICVQMTIVRVYYTRIWTRIHSGRPWVEFFCFSRGKLFSFFRLPLPSQPTTPKSEIWTRLAPNRLLVGSAQCVWSFYSIPPFAARLKAFFLLRTSIDVRKSELFSDQRIPWQVVLLLSYRVFSGKRWTQLLESPLVKNLFLPRSEI